jgi:hypothetical protein
MPAYLSTEMPNMSRANSLKSEGSATGYPSGLSKIQGFRTSHVHMNGQVMFTSSYMG